MLVQFVLICTGFKLAEAHDNPNSEQGAHNIHEESFVGNKNGRREPPVSLQQGQLAGFRYDLLWFAGSFLAYHQALDPLPLAPRR